MKKGKKKILAFILTVAFIGYGLIGSDFISTSKTFAHENIITQNQNIGCEQTDQNCEDGHTTNHCHSDYLAMPILKITFSENQNSLFSKGSSKLKKLNYPPSFQPA